MQKDIIQELIEKRELLCDIATELYGELWVCEDKFWNSPTELELREINSQLHNLGWTDPNINDDIRAIGEILGQELIDKGLVSPKEDDILGGDIPNWWEEEDEDDEDTWY